MTINRGLFLTTATILTIVCNCTVVHSQITTSWTGTGGNANFHNAGNWNNGVPGSQDEAEFDSVSPFTVSMDNDAFIKTFTHVNGTMTLTGGNSLNAGTTPSLDGFMIAVNPQTEFNLDTDFIIGDTELGGFTLLGGAGSDTANIVFVGNGTGVEGRLTVNGSGSTFTSSQLRIGQNGFGILNIQNSGFVSSEFGRVGHNPTAIGEATVAGSGSQWHNGTFIAIGANGGTGTLDIENGALVTSDSNCFIGTISTATGTVNITGSDSELAVVDNIEIGNDGMGTLNVMSGGLVTSSLFRIARRNTANGEVNVGGGGLVDATTVVVGREGDGVLNVSGGGEVNCDVALVGSLEFGTGEATITGIGSSLTCNTLVIGSGGIGDLVIENEANVNVFGNTSINSDSQLIFRDPEGGDAGTFSASGPITVNGKIVFLQGMGLLSSDINLVNDGELQVSAAIGDIFGDVSNNGLRILVSPVGELNFFGSLTGDAPFVGVGTATFHGNVKPGNSAGAVSFDGDVSLRATSTLEVEIGGTNPGSQYDQLLVDGDISLNGNMTISQINGFQPIPGQQFTIIEVGGTRTGTFEGIFQGDVVATIGNVQLMMEYFGGDGNDVALVAVEADTLLGDVNLDGFVNLLDVAPFVDRISTGTYQVEADINQDGFVNLLDVAPFVDLLSN